jgi:signal peptidase I
MEQVSPLPELSARPEASIAETTADPSILLPARPAVRVGVRIKPLWREWAETLLATLLIFLFIESFVVQGFKVYGSCMEPNLYTGERLLGNKLIYHIDGIHRGDIVVFRPPHRPDTPFIKRVIGLPGEVLEIRHSQVFINGHPLRESYLQLDWHDDRPAERIPAGKLFVMGDNRDNSSDSRAWGDLPLDNVQAKAWLRYWPLNRLEILR